MRKPRCAYCRKPIAGTPEPFCCSNRKRDYLARFAGEHRAVTLVFGSLSIEYAELAEGTGFDWTVRISNAHSIQGTSPNRDQAIRDAAEAAIVLLAKVSR